MYATMESNNRKQVNSKYQARPYCPCWSKRSGPVPWKNLNLCTCGEEQNLKEWSWERPPYVGSSWLVLTNDLKQVTFHPFYSSGTAVVRGNCPMIHNYHYYWEIKMLTDTYGTDILIGVGSNKVNISDPQFTFTSLIGQDEESYGLSYTGAVRHNSKVTRDSVGFCRGTIIGVRVDLWNGTLEFYVNREPQGIAFYNLRRHQVLFPMISSTAAQSSMKLIYAASWQASLLVDSAKILAASVKNRSLMRPKLPPGLWQTLRRQFWLTLPTEGCFVDDTDVDIELEAAKAMVSTLCSLSVYQLTICILKGLFKYIGVDKLLDI
ncbi:SPRY domain-containing SOCS box protein 3 isoform X1 [Bombyx mori]|uniref:SPRY domain-containing SOCS box protein 3 isoform X1 n=1 Tax=Bombyx mori TaxID=7091 RepID=UPI002ED2B625